MDASCPTCAAQAHELRIACAALRILASMLGEPVDMEALYTMAAHRLAEQGREGETTQHAAYGGEAQEKPVQPRKILSRPILYLGLQYRTQFFLE